MSRPAVSVVMPFAGDRDASRAAMDALLELDTAGEDELILVDNSGTAESVPGVSVLRAAEERSAAHARNVGAEHAHNDWILFIDADCHASPGLLDAYFAQHVAPDVGALAGEVVPAADALTLAERYGAARSFLSQEAHLAHPYRPRAVAANLLVRRSAFEEVGGFYEGVRAAEDTDFSWRIQGAGWRLELRHDAAVEHRYRTTLAELRRQWRGYAAGRAWLARRYDGFEPEPSLVRAFKRAVRVHGSGRGRRGAPAAAAGRLERGRYLALDALLAADELAGLALSNRPARGPASNARVVLVADRFPTQGDPLVEFARTLDRARVEAVARPDAVAPEARELRIDYREDDGVASRAAALVCLAARHPVRAVMDAFSRGPDDPCLAALAPAVLRLARDSTARVYPLGADGAHATARRLAALAGRDYEDSRGP